MRKYESFTETKIKKLPFQGGSHYCAFNEMERRMLLQWAHANRLGDRDPIAEEIYDLDKETIDWFWKRIIVKLKGFAIENSNLASLSRHETCSKCDNEFIQPFIANHRSRCKGKTTRVDREILDRI